ncbi:unnamed protein product [marine sediment metagenome]|uniref:Uncharacterized protein n=1 Tax=marine sediment metagenome TaxID=412755 RepID=X0S7P5_9ZZZZ
MKYTIPIRRSTITKNSNADSTSTLIPGPITTSITLSYVHPQLPADIRETYVVVGFTGLPGAYELEVCSRESDVGEIKQRLAGIGADNIEIKQSRDYQRIDHGPEPKFNFYYEDTLVQCGHCREVFSHTDLHSDYIDGGSYSDTVCPKCNAWDCVEISHERLSNEQLKTLAKVSSSSADKY